MLRIPFSAIAILAYSAIYFLLATLTVKPSTPTKITPRPTLASPWSPSFSSLPVSSCSLWMLVRPFSGFGDGFSRFWWSTSPSGLYFDFTIAANPQRDEWLGSLVISLWFRGAGLLFQFQSLRAIGCHTRHANAACPTQATLPRQAW